jgi:hypothetical protein
VHRQHSRERQNIVSKFSSNYTQKVIVKRMLECWKLNEYVICINEWCCLYNFKKGSRSSTLLARCKTIGRDLLSLGCSDWIHVNSPLLQYKSPRHEKVQWCCYLPESHPVMFRLNLYNLTKWHISVIQFFKSTHYR